MSDELDEFLNASPEDKQALSWAFWASIGYCLAFIPICWLAVFSLPVFDNPHVTISIGFSMIFF